MKTISRRYLFFLSFLTIAICIEFSMYLLTVQQSSIFFSRALKDERISETVSLDAIRYDVSFGVVTRQDGQRVGLFKQFEALRLAYALVLARRSPFFGITGTNPATLRDAIGKLSSAQALLAQEQRDATNRVLVEHSLYPTDFLNSLASLEEARLAFIASESDTDESRYEKALVRTSWLARSDARSLAYAYSHAVGSDTSRFPTLGSTITAQSLYASIDVLNERLSEVQTQVRIRLRCLSGHSSACDSSELILRLPSEQSPMTDSLTHFSLGSTGQPSAETNTFIALSESTCLKSQSAPYVFTYGDFANTARLPIVYSGEFFFAPTAGYASTTMKYLRESLHINYSLVNPIQFYNCPDVLTDIGNVYAVLSTVQFARTHQEYAKRERAKLLSETTFTEPDAIAYVRAAASDIVSDARSESDTDLSALETLLAVWHEKSMGLDVLVSAIASVDTTDASAHEKGIPFDVSARTLYLTHTAFPSLYLTHNPSAGTSILPLRSGSPADETMLAQHLLRYTNLIRTVSRESLARDVQAYLSFEKATVR